MTSQRHNLDSTLLQRRVKVLVVGAGGTGSHMLANLAVLHQSMRDLGHPEGLAVTIADGDTVSSANVGRSCFYECDVGLNKAVIAAQRINMCFGFNFKAIPERVDASSMENADFVIGCVDTRDARRTIWNGLRQGQGGYWMDIGNDADDGQVVLGHVEGARLWRSHPIVLPCVMDLYPAMREKRLDPPNPGPSCSRAEALRRQSAFVNKQAALHGISMLAALFRDGYIDHHAVFFNVRTGRSNTLPCDPSAWARFGYAGGATPRTGAVKNSEPAEEAEPA